jgi:hypothetical protein
MDGHNLERLKQHILPMSDSQIFEIARSEWDLSFVELTEEWGSCPCGQSILEHCYIINRVTKSETYVGNVCINRFMNIETGSLFDGLRRIAADNAANANDAVIEYANERGFLFDKEYTFLIQTRRRRKVSVKQLDWKKKINRRILKQTVVTHRSK